MLTNKLTLCSNIKNVLLWENYENQKNEITNNSLEMKNRDVKHDLDVMKMTDGQDQTEVIFTIPFAYK